MERLIPLIASVLLALLLSSPAYAVVYLCPTDGTGVDGDHFRSRAISELLPGRGNVDLRDDVASPGLMLCESDSLPRNMTGVVVLGNDRRDLVSEKIKSDVSTAGKGTLRGATVEAVIKELVIPRLPRPKTGTYEIHLGSTQPHVKETASLGTEIYYKGLAVALRDIGRGLLDGLQPAVAWAVTLATETFNCADATVLDCVHDWASKSGTTIDIVSNQASLTGAVAGVDYANVTVDTTDHEVSATVVQVTTGGLGTNTTCSVLGRTTADGTLTYYRSVVTVRNSGELNDITLVRTVANASTTLATDTTDWTANDIIAVRMVGTTISTRKNGTEILSVTDANISTGTYGGLRHFSDSASGTCTWNNWMMLDITSRIRGGTRWLP